ncbi:MULTISPECIES: hypothetical protein [Hyphomicrobiales]|uniref:hypothetical protein n=1 Tax=Hyphomicrobiales TaxID=356 RepID=UPI001BCB8809|nr:MULTISPECIES: hypothetical protein [Hyphomicrobiales]CAH1663356.1 conserved hypothetical protein [Hyphomicrobiales bacterium]MBS7743666.1 hypothetical protein [Chelatococcus sp. HY11]MBX3546431.1 hypothetical protein [Chelatococcus sp.]MCO5079730.1 hypothetical protein [Chelatococcus sp.]MCO5153767.1 hypothetical protein [Shinella sp.]
MPIYTIETTYHLPVYRHRSYEAPSLAEACRLAIEDDDWEAETRDYESARETYVTGAWDGRDCAYSGPALPVPSHFEETVQRKADHFEILLGLVKVLGGAGDAKQSTYSLERAASAVAKAEAILAGARDPAPDAPMPRPHILLSFDESEVCATIGEIIAGDETFATLSADAIGDDDIHAACAAVAAASDLSEERGSAVFRAALAALRSVERRAMEGRKEGEREKDE